MYVIENFNKRKKFNIKKNLFLANIQCSTIIENTLDFSYTHLLTLMRSPNQTVQLKASNALATFVYNNPRIQLFFAKQYQFPFDYFQKFLQNTNEQIRCAAAFQVCFCFCFINNKIFLFIQVVVLSGLIRERTQSANTAIGCGILIDILRKSQTDEGRSGAAECLTRLAHLKSG